MKEIIIEQKLIALCIVFAILLNFPILSLFNKFITISHIPILCIYIFIVWIVIIASVAITVSVKQKTIGENLDEIENE